MVVKYVYHVDDLVDELSCDVESQRALVLVYSNWTI